MQEAGIDGQSVSQTPQAGGHRGPSAAPSAGVPASPRVLLTTTQAAREVFGVSERTFQGMRAQSWFPKPVVLGPRLVRWVRSELEAAAVNIPRTAAVPEPSQLLRGKVERLKRGASAGNNESQPAAA